MSDKPNKDEVKLLLDAELQKVSQRGYDQLASEADKSVISKYEVNSQYGVYQVTIKLHKESGADAVDILGAIDGPGVRHFLGMISSVTDVLTVRRGA